jgi:diguanylate cyclase (GGDEF)-like protein
LVEANGAEALSAGPDTHPHIDTTLGKMAAMHEHNIGSEPQVAVSAQARLQQMREAFVNAGWTGLAWLMAVILGLSIWRVVNFPSARGWQFSLAMIGTLALLFYTAYFLRRKLPYTLRAGILVLTFLLGGASSLPVFGFAGGGGTAWLVTACFISAVIFPRWVAVGAIAFATLVLGVAAFAFVSGMHVTPVNLNIMLVQPAAWINVMLSVAATSGTVALALGAYSHANNQLLKDVELQRQQIEHMASHDNLTGLPLLRLAVDRCDMAIHHAQRTRRRVGLLFIDLDGFKAVNDTHGHEAGDHVLREVAARLKTGIRAADTAARIGGDEFIVMLTDLDNPESAPEVARKLVLAVGHPISYQGRQLAVGASIGISIFPDHARDTLALRKAADEAMYAAKKAGKNRIAMALAA